LLQGEVMEEDVKGLLEILETHRQNAEVYMRQLAIAPNDVPMQQHLRREINQIAIRKQQLHQKGMKVEDQWMDSLPNERTINAPYLVKNISHDDKEELSFQEAAQAYPSKARERKGHPQPTGYHIGWIIGLIGVAAAIAVLMDLVITDLYKLIAVFIFTLLLLGIVLPFIALQNGTLSKQLWFKSYVATLEKIPLFGDLLKALQKDK
jgi:hypothetical protein